VLDYFQQRRTLLDGSLTASQVAGMLGTSRQTPHDRVESGSLLAVMDRGALRFPTWQFDPEGPHGVVHGLPDAIRALRVSPLAKMSWLTRANPAFDGATPLDALRWGEIAVVVDEASRQAKTLREDTVPMDATVTIASVPVTEETHVMLEELARLDGASIQNVLARAVETYWGRRLNEASNDAYAALKADPKAWQELQNEQAEWEATLADGLDDE